MQLLVFGIEDILAYLKDAAENGLRTLCAMLCEAIYPIIAYVYDAFINIATLRLLDTSVIHDIYQRVTLILTIIMTFYITFEFIKYVIEPDNMSDKEKGVGKLLYRLIGVVVLIVLVPKIFSLAYDFQDTIIKNDAISKIILGKENIETISYGRNFSAQILSMYYYVEKDYYMGANSSATCEGLPCEQIVRANISSLANKGELPYMRMGINEKNEMTTNIGTVKINMIHFDGFWATVIGGLVLWMLLMYCVDLGTRAVQLIYLQVIAPIPIIGFLSPKKDGIFGKWCKQCLTTYLDVFLRLSLLNFILLICNSILSSNTFENFENNGTFVKICIILGLLLFAKRLPDLLKELFPKGSAASGNLGLKASDRGLGRLAGAVAGSAAGAIAGGLSGAVQGFRKRNSVEGKGKRAIAGLSGALKGTVRGTVGGTVRGLTNGVKKGNIVKNVSSGVKSQVQSNQRFGNRQENGYGTLTQVEDRLRNMTGMPSRVETLEKQKKPIKAQNDTIEKIKSTRKAMDERALDKIENAGAGGNAAKEYLAAKARKEELQKNTRLEDYMLSRGYKKDDTGRFSDNDLTKAKAEYGQEIQNANEEFDKTQKKAIAEYIQTEGRKDGAITANVDQMIKEIEEHNKGTVKDKEIHIENFINNIFNDYTSFSDEVKKHSIKDIEDRNANELIALDAEIGREKAKREGSGIGEGKK